MTVSHISRCIVHIVVQNNMQTTVMVRCEGFNPCLLSSVTGRCWRGHVLRCLPPVLMASITAGVSNALGLANESAVQVFAKICLYIFV